MTIRCNYIYIYIPWPSLDMIFHDLSRPSWFHISFMTCYWKSCGLVSPSNRKAEKATLPLIGKQQELPLLSLYLVLRTFAGYLRAFCGAFLSQKKVVQWPFRMMTTSSVLCGANLVLPNILTSQVLFEWFELMADICWYPAVPEWWQAKNCNVKWLKPGSKHGNM